MTIEEKYQQERERLELNRSLDWSTFSKEYTAAGEPLKPMTVQVWFDLLALNSPLLVSDMPTVESLVDYIWRNSKRHTKNPVLRLLRLFMLEQRVAKMLKKKERAEELIEIILDHIQSQLDEYPVSKETSRQGRNNSLPAISGEASMVDEIAHRYALHPDDVLAMPLRKAFSLQRIIRATTIPDYKLLEPESLRAIKSEYLQQINDGKK